MPDECRRSTTTIEAAEAVDEQQGAIQEPEKADITTPEVNHKNPPEVNRKNLPEEDEPSVEASNSMVATKTVDPNMLPINRIKPFQATPSIFPDREIGQFEVGLPENDKIKSIVSSSDQSMIAVGSKKGRIILYHFDDENGDQIIGSSPPSSTPPSECTPAYQGPKGFRVEALAFSPDNEFLAAMLYAENGDNSKLVLFRTKKDGTYHSETKDFSSEFFSLAFSNTSKQLAIGSRDGGCRMFDLEMKSLKENTKISNDLKQANCLSLSFCPGDDKLLVTGHSHSYGGCLLFDSKGSKLLNHSNKGTWIRTTAFSPDGMIYAVGTNASTSLHHTSSGQLIHSFEHESISIKFSKDGTRVYFGAFGTKRIYGYDVISSEKLFESISNTSSSSEFSLKPFALIGSDSQMVIGQGNLVRIVDTAVNLKVKELEDDGDCWSAAMSNDGDIMAIRVGQKGISMHNSLGQKGISMHNSLGQRIQKFVGSCYSATVSAKGDKLAVGGEGTTIIYSTTKDTEGSGFKIERLIIDHKAEGEDGEGTPDIYQVVFFAENGKDRIVSVLSYRNRGQSENKIVVHCAEEVGERLHADGITVPFSLSPVEVVPNTTSALKVWNNNQYVVYNYADGNVDHKFNFQSDIKKASRFSPDGSKLLVVIGKQLRVYEFSAEKGFNASNVDAIATIELSRDDADQIEMISHNGKNILAIAFEGGGIDVITFESSWKEGKVLYTIATLDSVGNMFFKPNTIADSYRLIVIGGGYYRIYEIRLSGINPTDPFDLLEKCYNEEMFMNQCARSSNPKSIPFHRNKDGDTLLQVAFVKGYYKYFEQAISESPEAVLALYSIRRGLVEPEKEWKSIHSIIKYCAKKNDLDRFGQILLPPELLKKFEPGEQALLDIVSCIKTLATYNATNTLAAVLDAGASGCIQGLVPGRKVWFLEPQKYPYISSKLENFKLFILSKLDIFKLCNKCRKQDTKELPKVSVVSRKPPQNSALVQNLQFMGYEDDTEKRIQLNICRVLLPNLASSEVLEALINMGEQYEGDSSSLKLFGKRSLRDSIDAVWNSWAEKRLKRQFLLYCTWLLSITALAIIRRINDINEAIDAVRISLMCILSIGWIYFAYLEARQATMRGISQYFSLSWNLLQMIGLTSTFLFVLMELVQPMGDVAIVCGALSQLFGWVNLLYYMRGKKEVAWVVYALLRIIGSMTRFLLILFVVVFSFALFFWSLELPGQFGRLDDVFLKTMLTSFFSDYDLDPDPDEVFLKTMLTSFFSEFDPDPDSDDLTNNRFKTFTLLFNLVVLLLIPLICLNAMIAFISETFADILDDRIAVIAREKANLIMDLYCGMMENSRKDLEKKNVWTFKLELQSTLDKIDGSAPDGEVANKRSTKRDIADLRIKADEGLTNLKSEMTEERTKVKASTKEMKGKMEEIKTEMKEMRAEMKVMLQLLQQQQK